MRGCSAFRGMILGIATWCAWPATASGAVLITRGETISHVADIPSPAKENLGAELGKDVKRTVHPAVGFRYKYWGIFWLDFWTWDGRFCIYEERTAWEVPPPFVAALLNTSEDALSVPFFYRFPPGLVVIAGFILLGVLLAVFKKSPVQRAKALVHDVRYERALEIIAEELKKEEDAAKAQAATGTEPGPADAPSLTPFDAAVDYLVSQGIARDEAQTNLALILSKTGPTPDAAEPVS